MSERPDRPEDEDAALAAEYVLGLLEGAERAAFEGRLAAEPALRAAVTAWEADFAAMAEDLPEVAPPTTVKARVMAALDGAPPARRWMLGWLALPGMAALALVAFLMLSPFLRGPAFDPTLQATLSTEDGSLLIEAGYASEGSLFRVVREAGSAGPGRDLELWVIGPDASAPVSLGVIPPDAEAVFEVPAAIAALMQGGILAVSDEPEGGSPTGAPTGDILATAPFADV
jgi:anti-sigma-K factor RskA